MKIGIVGAGAMGSLFSYYIHKSGKEVVLYETSKETVSHIKKGLTVILDDRTETILLPVSSDAEILRDCSYIFLFVKSYDTAKAVKNIRGILTPETRLISLQNGLGNEETIKDMLPDNVLLYGTTTTGAAKTGPATVKLGGAGEISIGGSSEEEISAALNMFSSVGLKADKSADPDRVVWSKTIINAAINPIGALLGVPNGTLSNNEHSLLLMRSIVAEAVKVAKELNIVFDTEEMQQATIDVCHQTAINECSMLQDVNHKRRTEIESITGELIARAKKYNIDVPFNTAAYHLIKALEISYFMA